MRKTADMTRGKFFAVWSQLVLVWNAVNPLVAFGIGFRWKERKKHLFETIE
jgi:predicted membrane protein